MGAGASNVIPMHVDLETFRRLNGSRLGDSVGSSFNTFNDPIFHQFAVDGVMSRDKLLELAQTSDCFLSFDDSQRDVLDKVLAIAASLRSRGLITWVLPERLPEDGSISAICDAIEKTRSVLFFMTQGYVDRTLGPNTLDRCHIEFNYALRRKFPEKMIPVVLERKFLVGVGAESCWPGIVGTYFGYHSSTAVIGGHDYEQQLEALFQRVVNVTRNSSGLAMNPFGVTGNNKLEKKGHGDKQAQVQILGVAPLATREEAQFFLWMTRATPGITETKRTIYCGALTHLGVTSVQKLAKEMTLKTNFLMSVGISEHDADEIALAISDLGLGYNPVRDFSGSSTLESAIYAMKKACLATGDPELAANALSCLARIVFSDIERMPKACALAGLCDPVVKLLSRYMGDALTVENGCRALESMAMDEEVSERLGQGNACDVIPRALQSHLTKPAVVEQGLRLIALLSRQKVNKQKFGTAGACDVVMRGLTMHVLDEGVALAGCDAAHKLAYGYNENIGKLAYSQGCEALTRALISHPEKAGVSEMCFRCMLLLAIDAEYRSRMGASGACEATILSLECHFSNPFVLEHGLLVHNTLIIGNANNRNMLGKSGACDLVVKIIQNYDPRVYPSIVQHGCTAIFSLASGSPDNQRKLVCLVTYLGDLLAACARPGGLGLDDLVREKLKQEASEAFIRLTKS